MTEYWVMTESQAHGGLAAGVCICESEAQANAKIRWELQRNRPNEKFWVMAVNWDTEDYGPELA